LKHSELTPEEKLMCAIFGEPAWGDEVHHHFLSDDGRKAVNDLLDDLVASLHKERRLQPSFAGKAVRVLRLRFGFEPVTEDEMARRNKRLPWHDSPCRTLDEVGLYFNVTRERIRQIEARALRLLRHPSRSRKLRQYLEVGQ